MVFASLLEYASVGYMAKRIQMRKKNCLLLPLIAAQKKNDNMNASAVSLITATQLQSCPLLPVQPPPPPNPNYQRKDRNKMCGMVASDIDKYSRVLFPVTFTCFQLMYWIIYQYLSSYDIADNLVYLYPDHL